jgi:hypothetical protein
MVPGKEVPLRTVTLARFAPAALAALVLAGPVLAESFQLPSYMESWSGIQHPGSPAADMFDSVKNCNLGGKWRLSFGGSTRLRFEADDNLKLGTDGIANDQLGRLRSMLHLDISHGGMFRWYSEIAHADTLSSDRMTSGRDENDADVQDFFLDFTAVPNTPHPVTFRLGRQEMAFGNERLVGLDDFSNVRNTFDGLRIIGRTKRTETSLFGMRPVERMEEHDFDETNDAYRFLGLHSEFRPRTNHVLQGYFFSLHDDREIHSSEKTGKAGDATYNTVGARYAWTHGGFLVETELAWQGGHVSDDDINAGFGTVNASYTWQMPWRPRLGWGVEVATGDANASDGRRGTFNPLFGSSHTGMGFMGITGRRNLEAARLGIEVLPMKGMRWSTTALVSQLEEKNDALYGERGEILRKNAGADNVGIEVESELSYEFLTHHEIAMAVSHLWGDDVIDNAGQESDATWGWVGYQFRF